MAKTYNRLEIDVNKKPNSIGIRPVQHDTKSRYLDVCLYENGVPINLTGEQVRITFRKADGSTFFNQGEVTDAAAGRCQFALANEILSEAKAVEAQISVWNAGGQILSTQVFEIYVTAAIPWTDAVESENEYGVLVVLFQEIQDALDTMHKIATTFGEPGDKAAEYGVDTFWGILETLAQRGDVESALENKIKAYLNSTIGTSGFQSLDKMLDAIQGGKVEFDTPGTFVAQIPKGVKFIYVTACAGGGAGGSTGKSEYSSYKGNDGEPTIIGDAITLAGGIGGSSGVTASPGKGGGAGGAGNKAGEDGLLGSGGASGSATSYTAGFGGGGGGSIGNGGDGAMSSGKAGKDGFRGGGGGGGYSYYSGKDYAGRAGGSGGEAVERFKVHLTDSKIQCTIGKGGTAVDGSPSNSGSNGGNGGDGYVKIEWGFGAL